MDSNHAFVTRPSVPILDLSKQRDPLALQLRILGTAPTSIGPPQDTWHLICISALKSGIKISIEVFNLAILRKLQIGTLMLLD